MIILMIIIMIMIMKMTMTMIIIIIIIIIIKIYRPSIHQPLTITLVHNLFAKRATIRNPIAFGGQTTEFL